MDSPTGITLKLDPARAEVLLQYGPPVEGTVEPSVVSATLQFSSALFNVEVGPFDGPSWAGYLRYLADPEKEIAEAQARAEAAAAEEAERQRVKESIVRV